MWPFLTDDNIKNSLRGSVTASLYPASLESIYKSIETCYQRTNAAAMMTTTDLPQVGGGYYDLQFFPAEFAPAGPIGSPLDNICRWNIPVWEDTNAVMYAARGWGGDTMGSISFLQATPIEPDCCECLNSSRVEPVLRREILLADEQFAWTSFVPAVRDLRNYNIQSQARLCTGPELWLIPPMIASTPTG